MVGLWRFWKVGRADLATGVGAAAWTGVPAGATVISTEHMDTIPERFKMLGWDWLKVCGFISGGPE